MSEGEYDYNFQLLSISVSLVYAYGLGVPVALWVALRYLGVGEWSVVEAVSIWGYGQFVWIPVSVSDPNIAHLLTLNHSTIVALRHTRPPSPLVSCRSRFRALRLFPCGQRLSNIDHG